MYALETIAVLNELGRMAAVVTEGAAVGAAVAWEAVGVVARRVAAVDQTTRTYQSANNSHSRR